MTRCARLLVLAVIATAVSLAPFEAHATEDEPGAPGSPLLPERPRPPHPGSDPKAVTPRLPVPDPTGALPPDTTTPTTTATNPTSVTTSTPLPRPRVEITATLAPDERRLTGEMELEVPNTTARPLDAVELWLFPNHLATRPAGLVDFNYHWIYPGAFSPGDLTVTAVTAGAGLTRLPFEERTSAAGPRTLLHVPLPKAVAPGETARVHLAWTLTIPRRLGSFGCNDDQCRLLGGFHPMPAIVSDDGNVLPREPARVDGDVTIRVPAGWRVVLDGRLAGHEGTLQRLTPDGREQLVSATVRNAGALTLFADKRATLAEVRPTAPGPNLVFLHRDTRAPRSRGALPYLREDRPGDVLAVAANALSFFRKLGFVVDGRELVIVQAPLRQELVQVHGDLVLVSDRWFEIFPLERLRKFHVAELARGVLTALAGRLLTASEPDADVDRAAALAGAELLDLFTVHAYRKVEHAQDLLKPVDFLPAVDQLLYAPLLASSSTYFGDIDERDPVRDDARRFVDPAPSGRFLYAKVVDLLGAEATLGVVRQMLGDHVPLRVAASRAFGGDLAWFWQQWIGPVPRVNYRLTRVRQELRAGTRWVTFEVAREGQAIREPVEVDVHERDGEVHHLVWRDGGTSHTFAQAVPSGLARVELDPRTRLVETATGSLAPYDDPRADNREPPGWRILYNGAGGLLDVTQQRLSFVAAIQAKPLHDLRNELILTVRHTPAVRAGASLTYYRLMGSQADRNRLTTSLGAGLGGSWLDPSYGLAKGEMPRDGWRATSTLVLSHDDRGYLIDPWHALGLRASMSGSLTGFSTGERLGQLSLSAEALKLTELAPGHVLAALVGAGATFGDIRFRSQLGTVGGNGGLRGYLPDELFSRAQALGRLELRNTYVANLDWNIAHFTAVRSLAGSVFVDGAAISSCSSLRFDARDLYADVGYSFRVLHDAFGVYQQLLQLDIAVPLDRRNRECLGSFTQGTPAAPLSRVPFTILVQFLPSF